MATAIVLPSCAVHAQDGYYDGYYYDDDDYRYDRYGDRYRTNDTLYIEDVSHRGGINAARDAHRYNAEYRAERLDGNCENVVTVRRGDTLSDIAEYCDVPVRSLLEANNLRSAHLLEVGQRLRVPHVKGNVYEGVQFYPARYEQRVRYDDREKWVQPVQYRDDDYRRRDKGWDHQPVRRDDVAYYTARRGDDLDDISDRFHVSERTIIALNPELLHDDVDAGDRIALPEEVIRYTQADKDRYKQRLAAQQQYQQRNTQYANYHPVVRVSDDTIHYGEDIEIIVEDLPPRSDIILSFGDSRNDMREYQRASTDSYGRYRHEIAFEDRSFDRDRVIIGVRTADNRYHAYSQPLRYSQRYSHLQ